jgi:hypothetical protein
MIQEAADLTAESGDRNRRDVVAGHDTLIFQSVGRAERDFGRQAADGRRDRRDSHSGEMRTHQLAREDQDRACLIQARSMNRSHSRVTGRSRA